MVTTHKFFTCQTTGERFLVVRNHPDTDTAVEYVHNNSEASLVPKDEPLVRAGRYVKMDGRWIMDRPQ